MAFLTEGCFLRTAYIQDLRALNKSVTTYKSSFEIADLQLHNSILVIIGLRFFAIEFEV